MDLCLSNCPQNFQWNFHLMFMETVIFLIDQNRLVSVAFMQETTRFEVALEQVLQQLVIEVILREIFDKFPTACDLVGLRVHRTHLFKESFSQKFVLNACLIHLFDKCEDLYDFGVSLTLQQSLRKH
jgi:hypothetical protein